MTSDKDQKLEQLLKTILDDIDQEDEPTRQRQIRRWRQMKLLWDGFSRTWWSATAHDWRIYDDSLYLQDNQAAYYDKPVNVFRGYLESIIAALSVTVPAITCYPDDAENALDLQTAKAGDKIAELIYKHNNVSYLWLHALFIYCTEGLTACYSYPKEDSKYGTYEEQEWESEARDAYACPHCQQEVPAELMEGEQAQLIRESQMMDMRELDEFMPGAEDAELQNLLINHDALICPSCMSQLDPALQKSTLIVERMVGITHQPKSRQCMEVYGGLYVKTPNYVMKQEDLPYLRFSYEAHYSTALARYPDLKGKIGPGGLGTGFDTAYEQLGRLNTQYQGEYPRDNTTISNYWVRPERFYILEDQKDIDLLKKKFPNGVKVVKVDTCIADYQNEALDDCWTFTRNPLSDYLQHDPLGFLLTSIQDITNTIVSLTLQTMEHGITQTFASPNVLNFNAYGQLETTPGQVIPTKASYGKALSEGFFETKTANLSSEVLPFSNKINEYGQFVSGATPSIFGGALTGSNTASEYSMSRAQALQRLQNTWKVFNQWWKEIFGKAIPSYIKEMVEDEKYVTRDQTGNFVNVFIRKSETEGRLGSVEIESSDQLPMTWAQKRDQIMELIKMNNEGLLAQLYAPENRQILKDALGLRDFYVPGVADREKQLEEIALLSQSAPIMVPATGPMGEPLPDPMTGMPAEKESPSIPIDPDVDNHEVEAEICRAFLVSLAGRQLKVENPPGYQNVLLHLKEHQMILQQQMMMQQAAAMQEQGKPNPEKSKKDGPMVKEESDVQTQ